eukprot:TRINITY_DN47277_c0_g1_i1.p2 TRINITY_DN47277_c0_g1~~TRINITY_DN47277_c0_g1_i1.p2  ORF type:complete len:108 (+),score=8.92 TRINITY_DN47277_c0_g1_i1:19-342(+)
MIRRLTRYPLASSSAAADVYKRQVSTQSTGAGKTLDDARLLITQERDRLKQELDDLSANLIEAGLATWAGGVKGSSLIVKGQSQLLENIDTIEQLETVARLFNILEA